MITDILFLPHGMQIIEGVEDEPLPDFMDLNQRMKDLVGSLEKIPDEIILLTPHGYSLVDKLLLYGNLKYETSIFKLQDSVVHGSLISKFEFQGSADVIKYLQSQSENEGLEIETLVHGSPDYPLQLNWGSSVPLYYFRHLATEKRITIMCYPRMRHSNLDGIREMNFKLKNILSNLQQKVMIMVSGDMSHVHQETGPYGYHETSIPFDQTIINWAETNDEQAMEKIFNMQPTALACGFSGIHLIHLLRNSTPYTLKTSFYKAPTYFGMGIFHWKR